MNIRAKTSTTFTSREFNQDTARAKRAAKDGPVFITTRGEATHVLITKEEFDRLENQNSTVEPKSLRDALVDPVHGDEIELVIPERRLESSRRIDLD
ncbi:type II toxin-antitoxin system prevent-host-death family antitoxin [Mesorhizobium sp. CN2-181]|uniref:type II toxin-antitoxin system prevent-host-death family antitoxin n=1 Tax=Mesorhizobium yinganensis TaxID=3157707 RepID=UPI0032B754A0